MKVPNIIVQIAHATRMFLQLSEVHSALAKAGCVLIRDTNGMLVVRNVRAQHAEHECARWQAAVEMALGEHVNVKHDPIWARAAIKAAIAANEPDPARDAILAHVKSRIAN